jgi:ApaG protein
MSLPEEKFTYTNFDSQIEIQLTPSYHAERSNPLADYYFYQYRLKINNFTDHSYHLLQRQWKFRCESGVDKIEHGDGLSHMDFQLKPYSTIEVSSFCTLPNAHGSMRGKLIFCDESGEQLIIELPLCFLKPPLQ